MNLDEFKRKAEELSKNFQESVMPEIKKTTESLKEKTGELKGEIKEKSADFKEMIKEKREEIRDGAKKSPEEDSEKPAEDTVKQEEDAEKPAEDTVKQAEKEVSPESGNEPAEELEHVQGTVVGSFGDRVDRITGSALPKIKNKSAELYNAVSPKVKSKTSELYHTIAPRVKTKAGEVAEYVSPKVKNAVSAVGSKVKKAGPAIKEKAKDAADEVSFQSYRVRKTAKKKTGDAIVNSLRENLFPNGEGKPAGKGKESVSGSSVGKPGAKSSSNAINHAKTIMEHRHLVFEHCVKAGIPLQGLTHDLSKFSPAEFLYGVKFFQGDRSPNEGEREDHGYSNAWMHHKGRNKHHFEYWLDYNIEANKAIPVKMPLKYVIEMFCDRVAAGKVYLKDKYTDRAPLDYFEKGRARRNIHPETSAFLEKLLKMLAKKGEDYTFMYIRWFMKHHDDY